MLSQVYKILGEKPQYIHCIEMALKNGFTLSYEHKIVKQELEIAKRQNNLEEKSIEEYDSESDYGDFDDDEDDDDDDDNYDFEDEEDYDDEEEE